MTRDATAHVPGGLRILQRALAVLELVGVTEGGLSLTEITKRLGFSVAVTHRILQTLVQAGYVEQDPRSRAYQLGLKVLELRASPSGAARIASQVRPYLRDLMLRTEERAHLAVYRSGAVVYVDRVDSPASLGRYIPSGAKAPAHATGLGKVLLAYLPEDELDAFLARATLERFTPRTITTVEDLRRELAAIRERGYAVEWGEYNDQVRCIAAPVFDYTGRVIAAVSVAGLPERIEPRFLQLSVLVTSTAREASRRFGHAVSDTLPIADLVTALP